jgi:hypothetical protein
MKRIVISHTPAGDWFYTIYIDERAVIVGMSPSRDDAEAQARLA